MAEKDYCGKPYRVITKRLRIPQGPGKPDRVVERPSRKARDQTGTWDEYLDDLEPTLVTFAPEDVVDVAFLLRCGAIADPAPEGKEKEVRADGKTCRHSA